MGHASLLIFNVKMWLSLSPLHQFLWRLNLFMFSPTVSICVHWTSLPSPATNNGGASHLVAAGSRCWSFLTGVMGGFAIQLLPRAHAKRQTDNPSAHPGSSWSWYRNSPSNHTSHSVCGSGVSEVLRVLPALRWGGRNTALERSSGPQRFPCPWEFGGVAGKKGVY